jgi:ubiquinone/menaquinone biosynthesis C-methylase UbiE
MKIFLIILVIIIAIPAGAYLFREVLRVPRRAIGLPIAPEVRKEKSPTLPQRMYWKLMEWSGMSTHLHREIAHTGRLQPGEYVLDIGSGTGELALLLKTVVGDDGKVAGIDLNQTFVKRSLRRSEKFGLPVEFQEGNAAAIPFEDDQLDAVTCSLMSHHLPTKVKRLMLNEIFRVLKPGGRLIFFDINKPRNLNEFWRVWTLFSLDLLFQWEAGMANVKGMLPEMLEEAGFVVTEEGDYHLRGVRAHFLIGEKAI